MIVAKNFKATVSPTSCDAAAAAVSNTTFYKNEDIPLSISASLAKQTRVRKNAKQYDIVNGDRHQDSNDDAIDYIYNNPNHHVYYSTMNSNGKDYLRQSTARLHRNINNNSTIGSTNRYRWHNQSDEIAMQSLRDNSMNIAATTKTEAMTMQSNYRSTHGSNRKQHHLNQINNNFIVSNKKQSIHNTNDEQNSIDQNNGNHYPSRLYH